MNNLWIRFLRMLGYASVSFTNVVFEELAKAKANEKELEKLGSKTPD